MTFMDAMMGWSWRFWGLEVALFYAKDLSFFDLDIYLQKNKDAALVRFCKRHKAWRSKHPAQEDA